MATRHCLESEQNRTNVTKFCANQSNSLLHMHMQVDSLFKQDHFFCNNVQEMQTKDSKYNRTFSRNANQPKYKGNTTGWMKKIGREMRY